MTAILGIIFGGLIFLAYPYLIYSGLDSDAVGWFPFLAAIVYFSRGCRSGTLAGRTSNLLIAGALLFGALVMQSLTAKLLPVLVQLMLFWIFGRTLFHGKPLIERFVRLDYPHFPPGIEEYCRQLTWTWTLFFGLNALACGALALWGEDAWWAFYSGFVILVLTAGLFAAEYAYRHHRFPDLDIPGPGESFKSILVNGRKIWSDVHAR